MILCLNANVIIQQYTNKISDIVHVDTNKKLSVDMTMH